MKKTAAVSIAAIVVLAVAIAAAIAFLPKKEDKLPSYIPEKVTVLLEDEGKIITVSYRDYIAGCLLGLVPAKYEKEALYAAAVAVNTKALYILSHRESFMYCGADFSDSDGLPYITAEKAEEAYGDNTKKYTRKMTEAAENGIKRLVICNGEPINAAMCEISSGMTDEPRDVLGEDIAGIRSVSAPYDREADGFESINSLSPSYVLESLRKTVGIALAGADCGEWFGRAVYLHTGTLSEVEFCGVRVTGRQLKEALGLRSAAVTIEYDEDKFRFTCHGCGDNLGMSLYSANALALEGCTAEEILLYFYPDADVEDG